ncbi:thiamine phosphate synthase [Clostridium brassicae]|uniref:Thiamine-phosphate synthase n=1 Tax=Clostridium brassicae TaxID=2999072 RepID=A0ABT4DBD4_9CLOT|nr:thiamine phosphate synthase [Clostridium brassicae]MCY6958983.1 thiamine phosphate synthase [Clostridium brassicae]
MLYLITNRRIIKQSDIYGIVEEAVKGGVDRIILREKDLGFQELLEMAERIKEIIKNKDVKLIINGNIEVARKLGAEGVHVGFESFMKEKYRFDGLIGVSVHTVKEAVMAEENGADYVLAGHVYETDCKKGLKPRGTDFIKSITSKVNIPVIALGGINETNLKLVVLSGAYGIAVMSYIMSSKKPYNSTKVLKTELNKAKLDS